MLDEARPPERETTPPGQVTVARAVGAAIGLALLSVVPVTWSLLLAPPEWAIRNSGFVQGPIDWLPMAPESAFVLSLATVLPSAVVGALAGGLVWRWRRFGGAAVALASGWAAGVVILPMAAAVLGVHLRAATVCVMGCQSLLRDDRPFGGVIAYGWFLAGTFFLAWSAIVPAAVVLIVISVLFAWVRGRPAVRPRLALIPSVIAFAAVHGIALVWIVLVTPGVLLPYVSLAIGVVAWTIWLNQGGRLSGLNSRTPSEGGAQNH
jgi:hypothetical protein